MVRELITAATESSSKLKLSVELEMSSSGGGEIIELIMRGGSSLLSTGKVSSLSELEMVSLMALTW